MERKRNHRRTVYTERTCCDCTATFLASRSDAVRCNACRDRYAGRVAHPGIGSGHGIKVPRDRTCIDCGAIFQAVRSDAVRCATCKAKRRAAISRSAESRHKHACIDCGTAVVRRASRCQSCRAKHEFLGKDNPNWKGGRSTKDGYIMALNPNADGRKHRYIAEHILIWETANGHAARNGHIHHLNGVKTDNRLENLQWMSMSEHHSSKGYEPYESRIRALEARIRELEGSLA